MDKIDNFDIQASGVNWEPLCDDGANFQTHELKISPNYIKLVPSLGMHLFTSIFAFFCLGIIFLMVVIAFNLDWVQIKNPVIAFMFLTGLFVYIFKIFYNIYSRILFFDLRNRLFIIGRKQYSTDSIVALQILKKNQSSDDGHFICYELNILHADGSRLNLISHNRLDNIKKIAKTIKSSFMAINVLDRSE